MLTIPELQAIISDAKYFHSDEWGEVMPDGSIGL